MREARCPECKAEWPEFVEAHTTGVKGLVQDVCLKCSYASPEYTPNPVKVEGRTVIIMNTKDRPQKAPEKVTKDERLTFKAVNGDMELTLSCGKDSFQRLLSVFFDPA